MVELNYGLKMKRVFNLFKVSWNEGRGVLHNFDPRRGVRFQESLKWVEPEKLKVYNPLRSGDLAAMQKFPDFPMLEVQDSKELETANEKVKKVFSLGYQKRSHQFKAYENMLLQKVMNHPYDKNSKEVKIAKLTARIRYYQEIIPLRPRKFSLQRRLIEELIGKRLKYIRLLREEDYKKFEWLLDVLDIEYRPRPVQNKKITPRRSLVLLAKLKVEQAKEEKLAELKQSLDKEKIPFLEKKIIKLKEIKEKEEKYNLPATVTQADINDCIRRLEEVKIEVAEMSKRGYLRKIHPYYLEPYDEKYLWEKEKAAEIIREEIQLSRQKKSSN